MNKSYLFATIIFVSVLNAQNISFIKVWECLLENDDKCRKGIGYPLFSCDSFYLDFELGREKILLNKLFLKKLNTQIYVPFRFKPKNGCYFMSSDIKFTTKTQFWYFCEETGSVEKYDLLRNKSLAFRSFNKPRTSHFCQFEITKDQSRFLFLVKVPQAKDKTYLLVCDTLLSRFDTLHKDVQLLDPRIFVKNKTVVLESYSWGKEDYEKHKLIINLNKNSQNHTNSHYLEDLESFKKRDQLVHYEIQAMMSDSILMLRHTTLPEKFMFVNVYNGKYLDFNAPIELINEKILSNNDNYEYEIAERRYRYDYKQVVLNKNKVLIEVIYKTKPNAILELNILDKIYKELN